VGHHRRIGDPGLEPKSAAFTQTQGAHAVVRQGDDGRSLLVTVRLRRLSGSDALRVTGTRPNTVYDLTTDDPLPTLRHGGEVSFTVTMVPARCDAHALGESYRTGVIGLVLSLGDGDPRPFDLVPPPDVRAQLEAFAVTVCRGG